MLIVLAGGQGRGGPCGKRPSAGQGTGAGTRRQPLPSLLASACWRRLIVPLPSSGRPTEELAGLVDGDCPVIGFPLVVTWRRSLRAYLFWGQCGWPGDPWIDLEATVEDAGAPAAMGPDGAAVRARFRLWPPPRGWRSVQKARRFRLVQGQLKDRAGAPYMTPSICVLSKTPLTKRAMADRGGGYPSIYSYCAFCL